MNDTSLIVSPRSERRKPVYDGLVQALQRDLQDRVPAGHVVTCFIVTPVTMRKEDYERHERERQATYGEGR